MALILINTQVNKLYDILLYSNSTFCGTVKMRYVIADVDTFIEYISEVNNKKVIADNVVRTLKHSSVWNLNGAYFAVFRKIIT